MMYYGSKCTHSEMDIMPAFEAVVGGSNPSGCTHNKKLLSKEFFVMCAPKKALEELLGGIRRL